VEVRLLTEHDADEFVQLRQEALTREPRAFARAIEDAPAWPPENVGAQLRAVEDGNFVVGAFEGPRMIGQGGFFRHQGAKLRHKGTIWGVYVTAPARGRGAARAMLALMLDRVRQYRDLEQVTLGVGTSQEAARRLYDAFGFEPYGYERHALKIGNTYVDEEHRVLWLRTSP
jgi:RimJ/RimL family protein N-acetyltransferase